MFDDGGHVSSDAVGLAGKRSQSSRPASSVEPLSTNARKTTAPLELSW
jgi:hypothetical protein